MKWWTIVSLKRIVGWKERKASCLFMIISVNLTKHTVYGFSFASIEILVWLRLEITQPRYQNYSTLFPCSKSQNSIDDQLKVSTQCSSIWLTKYRLKCTSFSLCMCVWTEKHLLRQSLLLCTERDKPQGLVPAMYPGEQQRHLDKAPR